MINLFVTSNEECWENVPAYMPKERCLTEYILPEYKNKYISLNEEVIEELKQIPCIFAYESRCKKDACIGKILEITVRQKDVRIDYELTGERIDLDNVLDMSTILDIGTWEMNRTHWTIKNVDIKDIVPHYVNAKQSPKIFVSYSWTPMSNQETVFQLVSRLRRDNISVIYDRDELHPGQNINYFMEQALERNDIDNIVVICNKDYADKANNREGGVGYEAGIIISEIKSSPLQRRVIPVAVEFDSDGNPYLPTKFKELYYIDLTKEAGYDDLLSAIMSFKKEK